MYYATLFPHFTGRRLVHHKVFDDALILELVSTGQVSLEDITGAARMG
jgi:hypothetical protein